MKKGLEKFVDLGFIHEFADLFHLDQYRDQIVEMEGRRMLILCTEALLTVVPSSSTGSKIATGLISPVRLALHSISFKI